MRYAVLDANNVVLNMIEIDPNVVSSIYPTAVPAQPNAGVGSVYSPASQTFSNAPAPVLSSPPPDVNLKQLVKLLIAKGLVTQAQVLAAISALQASDLS
jgi:hypothetical protein